MRTAILAFAFPLVAFAYEGDDKLGTCSGEDTVVKNVCAVTEGVCHAWSSEPTGGATWPTSPSAGKVWPLDRGTWVSNLISVHGKTATTATKMYFTSPPLAGIDSCSSSFKGATKEIFDSAGKIKSVTLDLYQVFSTVGTSDVQTAGGMCEMCPADTHAPVKGSIVCTPCQVELSFRASAGSAECTLTPLQCPDTTYADWVTDTCISCPKKGATCENNVIELHPEFWHDTIKYQRENRKIDRNTEVFECLNEESCIIHNGNWTGVTCRTGYSSVLCGACVLEEGWMRNGQICRRCEAMWFNYVFVGVLAVGALVYIFYVIAFQDFSSMAGDQRPVVIKVFMSFCQMLTVLAIFKARGTALFNEIMQRPAEIAGGGISSAIQLKCAIGSQFYGSFMMNMALPFIAAAVTTVMIGPVAIWKDVMYQIYAAAPEPKPPREVFTMACRRRKIQDWEYKAMMNDLVRNKLQRFQPFSRFVAVIVFVLFGIYPSLVKSIYAVFRCSEPIGGKRYLAVDYTVTCFEGYHPHFVSAAFIGVCTYLIGIPTGLFAILHINRHRLGEARFMQTFGFVYRGYCVDRGNLVAWEVFVMFRKLAVTSITVLTADAYIQIFVALLLLIIAYGMQERFLPFDSVMLNNIEGAGLFTLIFTQIISILYLYVDHLTRETGKRDKFLEAIVTLVLLTANILIFSAMGFTYVRAVIDFYNLSHRDFNAFKEERDEPFGPLTRVRNPYPAGPRRFEVFRLLTDCDVYTKPGLSSEMTGEMAEKGVELRIVEQ